MYQIRVDDTAFGISLLGGTSDTCVLSGPTDSPLVTVANSPPLAGVWNGVALDDALTTATDDFTTLTLDLPGYDSDSATITAIRAKDISGNAF